jgi:transposase InsO family protein
LREIGLTAEDFKPLDDMSRRGNPYDNAQAERFMKNVEIQV